MNAMHWENVRMAWQSLISNKMRSLLTMLGIIIGVASVIALVSIGYGVQKDIEDRISRLGSNLIMVLPGAPRQPGQRHSLANMQSLTYQDYAVLSRLPHVLEGSPMVRGEYMAVAGNRNTDARVLGVNGNYMDVRDLSLKEGRNWTQDEYNMRSRVAILGDKVALDLFGETNPIGNKIRINNDPFLIIGVLDKKGGGEAENQDNRILAPFTTVQERMLGITYVHSISLKVDQPENMSIVQADITNLLRIRHGMTPSREDDFTVENMSDVLETIQETTMTLTLFLGAVAAISLLVGGIGIMNIMLVSVTERTREIGIRKALGATYNSIIIQFLIEAISISVLGGFIGVLLGILSSMALSKLFAIATVITLTPILGAFLFSMGVGLIFGLYPARKAARLNPIDALHYE